jgi:hypothetical protein
LHVVLLSLPGRIIALLRAAVAIRLLALLVLALLFLDPPSRVITLALLIVSAPVRTLP